jgi:hypothetical protein
MKFKNFIISLFSDDDFKDYVRSERAKQRGEDDVFYLNNEQQIRNIHQADIDKLHKNYKNKFKEKLSEYRKADGLTISNLQNDNKLLREENNKYLQAIAMLSPFAHKMQIHYNRLAEEAKENAMIGNRQYAKISQENDSLEIDVRMLSGIMPKINNLIGAKNE